MIFEHYAVEQFPYGANILLSIVSSDLDDEFPKAGIEFITSERTPTTITFNYTEVNGELAEIDTNLRLVNIKKQHPTGYFTLSNDNIFNSGETPYIKLYCNNVKIPIGFTNVGNLTNKWWKTLIENDSILVRGYEDTEGTPAWARIAKNLTVSWNRDETQSIILEKNTSGIQNGSEFYGAYANFIYENNNTLSTSTVTVFAVNGQAPKQITVPRLDGVYSNLKYDNDIILNKKFHNYFRIAVLVRITGSGYETSKYNTSYYINGTNKIYDNTDFVKETTSLLTLKTENGFPYLLKSNQLGYKWHSKFFYTTSNNTYISPSSSEVKVQYDFESKCASYSFNSNCRDHVENECQCNFVCGVYNYGDGFHCEEYYECKNNASYDCYQYYKCKDDYEEFIETYCDCHEFYWKKNSNYCYDYYGCDLYEEDEYKTCGCYPYSSTRKMTGNEKCIESNCKCDSYCQPNEDGPEEGGGIDSGGSGSTYGMIYCEGIYSNGSQKGATGDKMFLQNGNFYPVDTTIFVPEGDYKVLGYYGDSPIVRVGSNYAKVYYYN